MFQVFHLFQMYVTSVSLGVSKVDIGKAHASVASVPRGSLHNVPTGGSVATACMRTCETERARSGPVHVWTHAASGAC
jgi:hypothetical protein